ncbi:MAG: cation-translocating P-type ATPase [Candidatus Saccharibacteria bacterium]
MVKDRWHCQHVDQVAKMLETDPAKGLSSRQASARLDKCRNMITASTRVHPLKALLAQFTDTMVLVLLGATIFSGILGDLIDAVTILSIVIINGILGFVQEYRAEKSLEEIKKLSSPFALVIRDGRQCKIPAEEVVPGDVIILDTGDRVVADIRLVNESNLEIEESCITGESLPVSKSAKNQVAPESALGDRSNMAFTGTVVTRGRGHGIVVATGMDTVMGQIAHLIQSSTNEQTPLQRRLDNLGKVLIAVCVAACLAVVGLGLYRGENMVRMLLAGISLGVAAVPEGLPAVVTVVLALGVQRMAKRNAIVRKLPAVETLGCTTVICSDKTGTLTQNQMTVRKVATFKREIEVTGEGYDPEGQFLDGKGRIDPLQSSDLRLLLEIGRDCNHAVIEKEGRRWTVQGDPTEGAIMALANKAGFTDSGTIEREIPFDSTRKMMSVIIKTPKGYRVCVKGALESVMSNCDRVLINSKEDVITENHRGQFAKLQEEWAAQAHRVLGFAYKDINSRDLKGLKDEQIESKLCLVGICGIIDPPRPSAIEAVKNCVQAGMIPIMITGDHPATALAIARQMGITESKNVIGPDDIEKLTLRDLAARAMQDRVLARVSPEHKLKIVKALKSRGHVVAMTGDGVNDAPAIKEADIGVAMGITGTEVTKEASAMVLADDDFSTIVAAVYEGRAIYDNIRKFIRYLLGGNIGEVLTMFLASLLGMPLPLLPIQILWVNLVTDGLPAMALGLEPPEPDVMNRPPRRPDESIFSRGLGWIIGGRGLFIGLSTLVVFFLGLAYSGVKGDSSLDLARTMAFTNLVFAQLFYVFDCRSENNSPFSIGFFTNPFLLVAVACSMIMQIAAVYFKPLNIIFGTTPLDFWQWVLVLSISGAKFFVNLIVYMLRILAVTRGEYVKLENVGVYRK